MPIDVVIPAHNAAPCVARAVRSALAQEHVGRVIVVADACTDDTEHVAREAGADVVIPADEHSAGVSRNIGVKAATSKWVAFLDADDHYCPHWLQDVHTALQGPVGNDVMFVLGRPVFRHPDGTVVLGPRAPHGGLPPVDRTGCPLQWPQSAS